MGTAQIIAIVLLALTGGVNLAKHGQARENYSFWLWLVSATLWTGLLWWGGFFQ